MKKIVSIFMVICLMCMTFMLASCSAAPNEVVDSAIEKTNELTSYEAKMTMNISVEIEGETMEVPMVINMKFADLDKEAPKVYMSMESEELGDDATEIYMDSEWVYMSMGGEGMKIKLEDYMDSVDEEDVEQYANDILVSLPADILKDVEVTKNDAGNKVVAVEIDSAVFKDLFKDALDTIEDQLPDIDDVDFENCKVEVETSKKGYIAKYSMSFDMVMELYDMEANTHVSYVIEFINPGEDVTVTPMEGYEDFVEID